MNQKNSLGLNKSFKDEDNPILLFKIWFEEAKKSELNDPNALSLATSDNKGIPSVRMVLLKSFDNSGFVFYTNLNSEKSKAINDNPNVSMCFHWKSLFRQIRITGKAINVSEQEADEYYNSRSYGSRIGAWASKQSSILNNREELNNEIEFYKSKFQKMNIPRLPVFTTEEGIKRIKEFFGKLNEWKNINELMPINLSKNKKFERTGKAGIFAGSLELAKEGNISIKQNNLFEDIFIKENK